MKSRTLQRISLCLIIFLVVFSAYLVYSGLFGSAFCIISGDGVSDCSSVQNSSYGYVFGIKVVYLGFFAYLFLLFLFLASMKKDGDAKVYYNYYLVAVFVGVLVALYFIFVQFFILREICSSCLVVDFGTIVLGAISYLEFRKKRRWSIG